MRQSRTSGSVGGRLGNRRGYLTLLSGREVVLRLACDVLSGHHSPLQDFWAKRGCLIVQPYNSRGRRGHVQPGDVPPRARPRAVERRVRRAVAPPGRRPLRRQPEPHCSSFTSSRSSSSPRRSTSKTSTSSRSAPSAPSPKSTTCASSRTTGSRRRSARGASAGKCGSTVSRFRSSRTSSRSAASTANRSAVSSRTASSASAMYLQDVETFYDMHVGAGRPLRRALQARRVGVVDVQLRAGRHRRRTLRRSITARRSAKRLLVARRASDPMKKLVLPAYDFVVKAAHAFNVLDARGAIGVTERARFIGRVRGDGEGGGRGLARAARGDGLSRCSKRAAE